MKSELLQFSCQKQSLNPIRRRRTTPTLNGKQLLGAAKAATRAATANCRRPLAVTVTATRPTSPLKSLQSPHPRPPPALEAKGLGLLTQTLMDRLTPKGLQPAAMTVICRHIGCRPPAATPRSRSPQAQSTPQVASCSCNHEQPPVQGHNCD